MGGDNRTTKLWRTLTSTGKDDPMKSANSKLKDIGSKLKNKDSRNKIGESIGFPEESRIQETALEQGIARSFSTVELVLETAIEMAKDGRDEVDSTDLVHLLKARADHIAPLLRSKIEPDTTEEHRRRQDLHNELKDVVAGRQSKLAEARSSRPPNIITQRHEYISKVDQAMFSYLLSHMRRRNEDILIQQIDENDRRLLDRLDPVRTAGFGEIIGGTRCLAGTRENVLRDLQKWALDPEGRHLLWLSGPQGSGKTAIALSFAEQLFVDQNLGASFFCARDSQERSDPIRIIPTLAYQLAISNNTASTRFRMSLLHTLSQDHDLSSLSDQRLFERLIVEPAATSDMTAIVIIDGLDECVELGARNMLSIISRSATSIPKIKFFFTSRPQYQIIPGYRLILHQTLVDQIPLRRTYRDSTDLDIRLFLFAGLRNAVEHHADRLHPDMDLSHVWPDSETLDTLTTKADGRFVFATTTLAFIEHESEKEDPKLTLRKIIDHLTSRSIEAGESSGLDVLYHFVLNNCSSWLEDASFFRLRMVLGLLSTARETLSLATIADILREDPRHIRSIVDSLRPFLFVPQDDRRPIRFRHSSFPEFLTDSLRCLDVKFLINPQDHHRDVVLDCFRLMHRKLKKNICGLPRYAMNASADTVLQVSQIDQATRYCCRYWANHLLFNRDHEPNVRKTIPALRRFLAIHFLLWVEVMGLIQDLPHAVKLLEKTRQWVVPRAEQHPGVLDRIVLGQRFLFNFFDIINLSVAHIYHSALPFTPNQLWLRQYLPSDSEAAVLIGSMSSWEGPISKTSVTGPVNALGYSPDGHFRAVGGVGFSRLNFQTDTGDSVALLDIDPDCVVGSISFSCDSGTLVTATRDFIRLWDTRTTALICGTAASEAQPEINTVAFHPTQPNILLSGGENGSIILWNTEQWRLIPEQTFSIPQTRGVICWRTSATSPPQIVVGSVSGALEIWELDPPRKLTALMPRTQSPYANTISAVASSSDGTLVASGSVSGTLAVYDATSLEMLCQSDMNIWIPSLQFSPDKSSKLLVCACAYGVYTFLPRQNPDPPALLGLHRNIVRSVSFLADGRFVVSGGDDCQIMIWEVPHLDSMDDQHVRKITCVGRSRNGEFFVTGSEDRTVRVWSTGNSTPLNVFRGHDAVVVSVQILHDNLHVVSLDESGSVILWNVQSTPSQLWSSRFRFGGTCTLLPYTHDGLGFFYRYGNRLHTGKVECWSLNKTGDVTSMVQVAYGLVSTALVDEVVVRIGHRNTDKPENVEIVLDCEGPRRYSALWESVAIIPQSPVRLTFIQEATDLQISSDCQPEWGDPTTSELSSLRVEDEEWVLDEHGNKIMWIPENNRGPMVWYGRRLVIKGTLTGKLSIIDFPQASSQADSW